MRMLILRCFGVSSSDQLSSAAAVVGDVVGDVVVVVVAEAVASLLLFGVLAADCKQIATKRTKQILCTAQQTKHETNSALPAIVTHLASRSAAVRVFRFVATLVMFAMRALLAVRQRSSDCWCVCTVRRGRRCRSSSSSSRGGNVAAFERARFAQLRTRARIKSFSRIANEHTMKEQQQQRPTRQHNTTNSTHEQRLAIDDDARLDFALLTGLARFVGGGVGCRTNRHFRPEWAINSFIMSAKLTLKLRKDK